MQGWECPKCHRTYAPWVATCNACAAAPAAPDTAPLPTPGPLTPTAPPPTIPVPRPPYPPVGPRYGTGDFPPFGPVVTCDSIPSGVIEFRDSGDGTLLGRITTLGV